MKKKVRIYKSPNNKGEYLNKTKKFLSKFQNGGALTEHRLLDAYAENVFSQLNANMKPEDIYENLLVSGLDKEMAGSIMTNVITKMIQAGLFDPQYFEKIAKQTSSQGQAGQQPSGIPQEMTDLSQSEEPYEEDAYSEGDQSQMMAQDQTSQLSMQEGGAADNSFEAWERMENEVNSRNAFGSRGSDTLNMFGETQDQQNARVNQTQFKQETYPDEYQAYGDAVDAKTKWDETDNDFGFGGKEYPNQANIDDARQEYRSLVAVPKGPDQAWHDMQEGGDMQSPEMMQEQPNELEQQQEPIPFDQYMDSNDESPQLKFPNLSEYLNSNEPSWNDISQMQTGGITKRKFVKSLLKKQEGGDSQSAGTGDRQDTLTNEIKKRKNDFTSTLKQLSTKALGEEIYDNAQKLGDPKVMEMAEGLVQKEQSNIPEAQKGGALLKKIAKAYPDLKPVTNFNKLGRDELKQLSQVRGLLRDKSYAKTANDATLRKKLNSALTSHVSDADLQLLFPGTPGKEGILTRIAQGRGPNASAAADLQEAASFGQGLMTVDDAAMLGSGNVRYEMLHADDISEAAATSRFADMLENPFSRTEQGYYGLENAGIGTVNLLPSLYAKDFYDPAGMIAATKSQAQQLGNMPIGSIATGSDNLTIDSKLLQDSMFGKIMTNPEAYGVFENPLFTGYGRLAGEDLLTDGYWKKKLAAQLQELEYLGLSDQEKVMRAEQLIGDSNRLRRDYYMTQKSTIDNRFNSESPYPILEFNERALTQAPSELSPAAQSLWKEGNWGLGRKSPHNPYDFVVPQFGLGKLKQVDDLNFESGGYVDDQEGFQYLQEGASLPAAQRGGAAYKVAKAFSKAASDEENAVDPWEGYDIRDSKINYNRQSVPYGTFSGRRGRLRDMLFPANRAFGRIPYVKSKTDYTGPMGALTPLRREVTKTNWRGRPKKWTDYYTTGSGSGQSSELQDQINARNEATKELISFDPSKRQVRQAKRQAFDDQYGDFKGSTQRKIKRGERQVARDNRRAARNPEGIVGNNVPQPFRTAAKLGQKAINLGKKIKERVQYSGGGFTNNMGVNTNQPNMAVNPEAEITNLDPNQGMMGGMGAFMNNNTPTINPASQPNNINVDPNQAVDPIQENFDEYQYGNFKPNKNDPSEIVKVENKLKRRTKITDGESLANQSIAGIRGIAGLKSRFNTKNDYADYNDEMTRPENLYANTVKTYKGEEADVAGKQLGLKNFDQMGQMDYTGMNTAKYGRFMQEGGYMDELEEDGEYELPEELIEYLIANGVELDFM